MGAIRGIGVEGAFHRGDLTVFRHADAEIPGGGEIRPAGFEANPNALECLYSPLVEKCTPVAQESIDIRAIFLSRHIHRTYNSYVLSQFKKIEQDLRNARRGGSTLCI